MNEKLRFAGRVTVIHVLTYIVCGMIFSTLFNYEELFTLGNVKYFMRDMHSASILIGPLVQVIRGLLFGLVLLLFRDSFMGKRYGWIKLYLIILVLGIINTPGPAPFSIEGFIYTQLPLEFQLKGAMEILIQTLLFSFLVTVKLKVRMPRSTKNALIVGVITGIGFSVSGIVLAAIIGADAISGAADIGALLILLAAAVLMFCMTKWYMRKSGPLRAILFCGISYIACAAAPTVYNFLTGSPFASYLSLLTGALPVLASALFLGIEGKITDKSAAAI